MNLIQQHLGHISGFNFN